MTAMPRRLPIVLVLALALLPALAARAQAPAAAPVTPPAATPAAAAPAPIRAAVFLNPPFVMREPNGTFGGFAVDLWDKTSAELGRTTEYVAAASFEDLLAAVRDGKVDVGISDVFVTSDRQRVMDFTHPFADGGLRIMVHEKREHSIGKLLGGLEKGGHLRVLGWGLLAAIGLSIPVVMLLRRVDKQFTPHWHEGFAEAFYHVMSIAMTGKTSYKNASGWLSRIFAAIWMVFGVATVAYITSSLSSVMTTDALHGQIHSVHDLAGKTIGVLKGSVGERYCAEHHYTTRSYADLDDAVKDLVARELDVVVAGAPVLEYYDTKHPELPITEVGAVFEPRKYAYAVPLGSPLRHDANVVLLKLQESGATDQLHAEYFGK